MRDALIWSVPALLAGLILRLILLRFNPYAYWSEDSLSYIQFTWDLFENGKFDLDPKRRWLYPIYLAFAYLLPGPTLRWVSILQHAAMLAAVIPFAYVIRKVCRGWRWWIVPGSLLAAVHPYFLYYSDQALAEAFFVIGVIGMLAGWVAWVTDPDPASRKRFTRFLLFFVPFAIVLLLKPSGRMFWPGVLAALVLLGQWRSMRWPHLASMALLLVVTPTVGKSSQGTRLLYTSTFPFTRLDSDLHRELKAGIADMVKLTRGNLRQYYNRDNEVKNFLEKPSRERPDLKLWAELDLKENRKRKSEIYRELSLEAMRHKPHLLPVMLLEKMITSHVKGIKMERFLGTHQAERIAEDYYYPELSRERPKLVRKLFGLPDGPLPELAWFQQEVAPHPSGPLRDWFMNFCQACESRLLMIHRSVTLTGEFQYRITLVGWLTLAGLLITCVPPYVKTMGAISLMNLSYLGGVFAVGSANPRFIVPAEPWTILLLLLPAEAIYRLILARRTAGKLETGTAAP